MSFVREAWFGVLWFFDLPRAKRIDATEFPEDEFPVWCMRCGYELRGLPENRCPECGTPFDRGELLVWAYVRGRRAPTDRRYARGRLLTHLGFVLLGVAMLLQVSLGLLRLLDLDTSAAIVDIVVACVLPFVLCVIGLKLLAVVCLFAGGLLLWMSLPPEVRKRWRKVQRAALRESRRLREALYYAGRKEPHA